LTEEPFLRFFDLKLFTTEGIMANTKTIADKTERKKVKRAARKKAAPKAKRTHARGSLKAKIKKAGKVPGKR